MDSKIFWGIRALVYSLTWGSFKLPSYIGKPIYIKGRRSIFIGKRVRIYPHSRFEIIKRGGKIVIEDDVSIGQNLHITAGLNVEIRRKTTISSNVLITDVSHSYENLGEHIMSQNLVINETKIGQNCFIGSGVIIDSGTYLGDNCIVGANSVLKGKYPENSVIVGAPGKIIKRYNVLTKKWEKLS